MSTLNEPHVYEQVLYRGKGKNKWEQRNVSVKRSENNGKSVVKVLPTQRKRISWRRKKPETFELSPNSHAIIHMSSLGDQRNVIGILPLRRGPQPRGHFFTSESREVLDNLKAILTNCCDVASFEVDFEKDPKSSASTKAQLHIFRDRVCLSTNLGYEFKLLREWPIDSLSWLPTAHVGVTLIPFSEAQEEETLLLRTERGNDICAKLTERHCYLAPTGHQQFQYNSNLAAGVQRCDGNSNIMSTSRLSKSCESVHQLHFQPLGSKSKTFPLTKAKPSLGSRQLSSLSRVPSYLQAKSPLSSDESISKKEIDHHFSVSSSPASTGQCSNSDNDVNAQKQLELTVHKVCNGVNGTKDDDELSTEENQGQGEQLPPPIPQRQPQHNSAKAESTKQAMEKSNDNAKYSERNYSVEDLTIQRTRSFQIVEQPLSGHGRRQRYKSDSSLVTKTAFTELVRPICLDLPSAKSDNHGSYLYLQKSGATNTEPCEGVCSQKQEEENACSCAGSENGVEPFESEPTAIQSRASTSVFVDEKSQVKDDADSSDSTCHYVNLPEGSRPSCYLYMNLPDLRKAPKEATSYVNHVFMSRSMKGIYENVQQFYNEKFETAVSSEEGTSAPPLPPPALHPRQPPPRVPKRASKDQQGVQKSLDRPPIHIRVPLGPPPPRPPKKHLSVTKEGVLNPQQDDIQVQIAVFASKAVAGRVWFLRIVVMKHDPDDTTFKTVKDREIASKYHLMQTYPFSISSDIVVSLKHQCQQFKLTSEDYQEVEYNIIGNLVHGFWFVIEFHLEHMGSDTDQFVGNVCVEPKNLPAGEKCPVNKRVNLGITEDFNLKQNSGCDQHGNPYMQGSQACKPVIPDYAKQKEICSKLDITMYSGNNWRDVAGKLGFDTQEIKIIDDKARRCPNFSPMENVLTTWEQRDPGCSLDRLVNILRDIQRLDVVSDLGFPVDLESS